MNRLRWANYRLTGDIEVGERLCEFVAKIQLAQGDSSPLLTEIVDADFKIYIYSSETGNQLGSYTRDSAPEVEQSYWKARIDIEIARKVSALKNEDINWLEAVPEQEDFE